MCTYLLHAPLPVSVMGFTGYVTKLGTLEENEETIEEQEEEILLWPCVNYTKLETLVILPGLEFITWSFAVSIDDKWLLPTLWCRPLRKRFLFFSLTIVYTIQQDQLFKTAMLLFI